MCTEYSFSEKAAMKMLLHAARHTCTNINGLLIGQSSDTGNVKVTDAVPLFHSPAVLGPCFETAMVQVMQLARTNAQDIVGFYEADPQLGEVELSSSGRKIGERLLECGLKTSSVFVLDNARFGQLLRSEGELPVQVYGKSGDRWKRTVPAGEASLKCEVALSRTLNALLADKKHYELADFDDHLDDIRRDWRNTALLH